MSVFAGFWVDGAVRKPEQRHCDMDDTVIAKWKRGDDTPTEFDICRLSFSGWEKVYWLDTTPRVSLTPEELFSLVRVIWPKCENVFDPGNDADVGWQVQLDETEDYTPVEWNGIGAYPPPVEPEWIRITRENVGQYLFRECRFRDSDSQEWRSGKIAGWCGTDDNCLVNSDYTESLFVMQWNIVEVQNAPAS